ncbi:hypothetical protein M9H77_13192 [Catharanthus roseus]|uniref:Uncharacterized protein n=1 Tax=Catharanthus roseus TaxID=4058 RepID=A0ACC0BJM4_CATRO|nr:hypothetical protein M9H77_13192 [Catharanthus roseus]
MKEAAFRGNTNDPQIAASPNNQTPLLDSSQECLELKKEEHSRAINWGWLFPRDRDCPIRCDEPTRSCGTTLCHKRKRDELVRCEMPTVLFDSRREALVPIKKAEED